MSEKTENLIRQARAAWNGQRIPSAPANTLFAIESLSLEVDSLRRLVEEQRAVIETLRARP